MDQCKAYKNKYERIQCTIKIKNKNKNNFYCGKHKNTKAPAYDNFGQIVSDIQNSQNPQNPQNPLSIKNQLNIQSPLNIQIQSNKSISKSNKSISASSIINNSRIHIFKLLENSNIYSEYLLQRKNYIKDSNKYIELIEYIENNKLDYYPNSRILASLEYYKLVKKQDVSKFMLVINNINLLVSLFETLLRVNINLSKIIKLQKWIKKSLYRYKIKLHGIALHNRALCVNNSDFVSLDDLKDIPESEFISFKDDTNFIYGFHIDSIIELIFKSDENYYENFKKHSSNLCYKQFIKTLYNHYNKIKIFNPYTRFTIDSEIKLNVIKLYTIHKLLYKSLQNNINHNEIIDIKVVIRNKCFSIFQKIDMMGYFTDTSWILDENIKNIKLLYKKLASLWNFEFGLNNTARYKISRCHDLFQNLHDIMISRADKYALLDKMLDTLNILISNGENDSDKNTGCILVLYGLAFINNRCILANPWLG
jgi:hypothetical protein